jgi:hypothetical protein
MIKARKGKTIILGLSDENIDRLKKGQPILFNMKKDLELEDYDVLIFNGRTEESMYESMLNEIDLNKTKLK